LKKISSADNAQFKSLLKLAHSSRERRLAGCSLLDGVHLLQAYQIRFGAPEQLIVSHSGADNPDVQALVQSHNDTATLCLDDGLFKLLSTVATPTGVIAVVKTPRAAGLPSTFETIQHAEFFQHNSGLRLFNNNGEYPANWN